MEYVWIIDNEWPLPPTAKRYVLVGRTGKGARVMNNGLEVTMWPAKSRYFVYDEEKARSKVQELCQKSLKILDARRERLVSVIAAPGYETVPHEKPNYDKLLLD